MRYLYYPNWRVFFSLKITRRAKNVGKPSKKAIHNGDTPWISIFLKFDFRIIEAKSIFDFVFGSFLRRRLVPLSFPHENFRKSSLRSRDTQNNKENTPSTKCLCFMITKTQNWEASFTVVVLFTFKTKTELVSVVTRTNSSWSCFCGFLTANKTTAHVAHETELNARKCFQTVSERVVSAIVPGSSCVLLNASLCY